MKKLINKTTRTHYDKDGKVIDSEVTVHENYEVEDGITSGIGTLESAPTIDID